MLLDGRAPWPYLPPHDDETNHCCRILLVPILIDGWLAFACLRQTTGFGGLLVSGCLISVPAQTLAGPAMMGIGDKDMTRLSKIPTFTIRHACLDDFDAMGPLWHQLDGYHQGYDPNRFPGTPKDAPRSSAYIAEQIHCADRALLVAEKCPTIEGEGGALIGLSLVALKTCPPGPVYPVRVKFEIENLVVAETSRRQGVARALLNASEDWARQNGASEMLLNVYAFNEGATHFYESLGFQPLSIQMVHTL